jgi:hypothetical protein
MKNLRAVLVATAALVGCAGAANATTTYDASLGGPGVYFGSGNTDNHFTVDNEAGGFEAVQIGLTAVQRYLGNYTPQAGTSIYDVATGPTSVSGKTGSDWGVTFSVDLTGGLTVSQIATIFTMQDLGNGNSESSYLSFDLKNFPDNGTTDGTHTCPGNGVVCALTGPEVGFQNSEPGDYLGLVLDSGFDMNANDTYIFTLDVIDPRGVHIGTDSITVVAGTGAAVPEPVTLSMFGAGLVGAIGFARRRKAKEA